MEIPSFSETVLLSAEEAASVRLATRLAESSLEEDIWGQRGVLFVEDLEHTRFNIKPIDCEQLISCPVAAIQNAKDESGSMHSQQCFFRVSIENPRIAEEVWLREPVITSSTHHEHCQYQGLVFTSNAHAKRPFCHVRLLSAATGNVECSTFNMPIRAADMVLGRSCMLDYEEKTDQRTGRAKLVATNLHFDYMEGLISRTTCHGVYIQASTAISYSASSTPIFMIFAAFDRCMTAEPEYASVGSRVFYHLHGPLAAPEACDWQVEGSTPCPKWSLPRPPKLSMEAFDTGRNLRWFPEESGLVIASDPKCTKFRDDAFECKLDKSLGYGYLRVHIVNMASRIPRNSPQDRWMRRILSRHHPADADNTRMLFDSWTSTSAGIGFTVQEHRPALTMQLNMKLVESGWAVDGLALFFESMVRLSVLIDSEKVTEEWIDNPDDISSPTGLILHPIDASSELEKGAQQVFHDAQVVRDNRWRRLGADGQLEDLPEDNCEDGDNEAVEGDENALKLPKIWSEFNYNSNSRAFTVLAEELQPSHFYAKRLLNIMNSEVFHALDGYKELFGLSDSACLEILKDQRDALITTLSETGLRNRQDYENASGEDLKEFVWKDLGGSLPEIAEALGWGAHCKKMAMMADVADGMKCHFEFTKPGRLYSQLASQRLFLDFVKNDMRRPRQMSYSMGELRHLMGDANQRQELNDRMVLAKHMALLKIAMPQVMQHGGLPTKGVVVRGDLVFASVIKEHIKCPSLVNVIPRAAVGTKVIIQLKYIDGRYTAELLAVHGRRPKMLDTVNGKLHVFQGDAIEDSNGEHVGVQSEKDTLVSDVREASDDSETRTRLALISEEVRSEKILRANAPAFYPQNFTFGYEELSTEERLSL